MSAIIRSNSARALPTSSPSFTPSRPSAVSRSGTLLAQSPARIRPIEMGYGMLYPENRGSGSRLRSLSSSRIAIVIGMNASNALTPSSRVLP